jgi:hypothetical protein
MLNPRGCSHPNGLKTTNNILFEYENLMGAALEQPYAWI